MSEVIAAVIMVVIAAVAAVMLYGLFVAKWFTPAAALDLMLDPSTLLTGKVGTVVVLVQSGSAGAKSPEIAIYDAETGDQAAACDITSEPAAGGEIYSSGDKITARCTANTQFYRGKPYVVEVAVVDAASGAKFVKAFRVTAQ